MAEHRTTKHGPNTVAKGHGEVHGHHGKVQGRCGGQGKGIGGVGSALKYLGITEGSGATLARRGTWTSSGVVRYLDVKKGSRAPYMMFKYLTLSTAALDPSQYATTSLTMADLNLSVVSKYLAHHAPRNPWTRVTSKNHVGRAPIVRVMVSAVHLIVQSSVFSVIA
jgi:hypothetical protein